ncbi:hypothetical protein CYY_005427 [Polysphondylium violaceum]|uniref:Cystatin domain-containing protein n=1 Tax=Polysphondylium violaceum TaxID=133409 RepID=A0A8J4PU94_9MYCE|nr:hypothetical protein CYY_005427 [Polysphondylium violaceum]
MSMPGGISRHPLPITEEVKQAVEEVKPQVETKLSKTYCVFEPISYKKQVVAGVNYFVKVKTNDGYVHLRIFRDLKDHPTLKSIQQGKTLEDDITYF